VAAPARRSPHRRRANCATSPMPWPAPHQS
jgi:hypothetical protein